MGWNGARYNVKMENVWDRMKSRKEGTFLMVLQWPCVVFPLYWPTLMTNVAWLREHHGAWDCSTGVIDSVKVTLVCAIRVPSEVGNSDWGDFWAFTGSGSALFIKTKHHVCECPLLKHPCIHFIFAKIKQYTYKSHCFKIHFHMYTRVQK